MMDTISIEGNAKINLTLDILGKRPDGFPQWSGNVATIRFDGKKDTAAIVAHAESILQKYVAEGLMTDADGHTIFDYLPAGADHVIPETTEELADLFVDTEYEGGRHQKRIDMITDIEKSQ